MVGEKETGGWKREFGDRERVMTYTEKVRKREDGNRESEKDRVVAKRGSSRARTRTRTHTHTHR